MDLEFLIHALIPSWNSVSPNYSQPISLIQWFIPIQSSISYLFAFFESGSGCFTRRIFYLLSHCWIHSPWKTCSWCCSLWFYSSSLSMQWLVTVFVNLLLFFSCSLRWGFDFNYIFLRFIFSCSVGWTSLDQRQDGICFSYCKCFHNLY